jgi:hypothetical protein
MIMAQDTTPERDPIEEYWATYGPTPRQVRHEAFQHFMFEEIEKQEALKQLRADPWTNGKHAFAALVWGLIFMLLISLEAGI